MKKDKLHTEDGSEFTVFYLGQEKGQIKHEPDDSVEEQIQDYFDKGKLFWGSDLPTSKEMKKAKNFLKDNFKKYAELKVAIDDTIESDIIKEPVANEIYRVKGLNSIVKFIDSVNSITLFSMSKNVDYYIWKVQINKDIYFYLDPNADMLLKATNLEKEKYNNENI